MTTVTYLKSHTVSTKIGTMTETTTYLKSHTLAAAVSLKTGTVTMTVTEMTTYLKSHKRPCSGRPGARARNRT